MNDPTPQYDNPFRFDMLLLEPCHEMMQTGIRIDETKLNELRAQTVGDWNVAQETLNKLAGWKVNVASSKHVPGLLYEQIGLPKKTKKDKKTQKESPEKWAARAAVFRAVKKVKIIKPGYCDNANCMETEGLEAHHYNGYAKKNWLDVIYLCKKHHIEAHEIIGNIYENPELLK